MNAFIYLFFLSLKEIEVSSKMYVGFERTVYMKLSKALLLLSAFALVACSHSNTTSTSSATSTISSESSVITSSKKETTSSTSEVISTSTTSSTTSSITTTSSEPVVTDKTVSVNLFNNTACGTMSTEVLNTRLADYINGLADTPFITAITNKKSQIAANIPEKDNSVLIVGSSSETGSLGFQFNVVVKKVTITAQTYYKPYTNYQTGEQVPNVDSNSVLQIAGKGTDPLFGLDLKSENSQPVEKTINLDIDSNTLQFNSLNADKGRVFIKALTFIY